MGMRITPPEGAVYRASPALPGVRVRVLAGAGAGAGSAGMVEMRIAPGAELPAHAHGDAEALVHVVSGLATLTCAGRTEEVTGGAAVHVPRGAAVAVANWGAETLVLSIVFSPAGFERRFERWPPAAGPPARTEALLDLTRLPRTQRYRVVAATLEALDAGTPLAVVSDHEPVRLRARLERLYGGRLGWAVRRRAPGRVVVVVRLDDGPAEVALQALVDAALAPA